MLIKRKTGTRGGVLDCIKLRLVVSPLKYTFHSICGKCTYIKYSVMKLKGLIFKALLHLADDAMVDLMV